MLHQQESLVYMIRREHVESSVAQIFRKWEGKNREEKANMVVDRDLSGASRQNQCKGSAGCWMPRWGGFRGPCGLKNLSLKQTSWYGTQQQTNSGDGRPRSNTVMPAWGKG